MLIVSLLTELASGQVRVEKNVVFGMYSGLALLMDVHRPAQPNGYALIVIPGSGWYSKQTYDAAPLTALQSSIRFFVPKLLDAGYTLFVVNHRSGPRFHYPAPVEDVQRAVRFIRLQGQWNACKSRSGYGPYRSRPREQRYAFRQKDVGEMYLSNRAGFPPLPPWFRSAVFGCRSCSLAPKSERRSAVVIAAVGCMQAPLLPRSAIPRAAD
jgi:hypothetical protein